MCTSEYLGMYCKSTTLAKREMASDDDLPRTTTLASDGDELQQAQQPQGLIQQTSHTNWLRHESESL